MAPWSKGKMEDVQISYIITIIFVANLPEKLTSVELLSSSGLILVALWNPRRMLYPFQCLPTVYDNPFKPLLEYDIIPHAI